MNPFSRCAIALALAFGGTSAHAVLQFTDWTSNTSSIAYGNVGGIVSVSISGPIISSNLNGGSPAFSEPLFSPALPGSDYIEITVSPVTSFTLTFSEAVTDPLIHIASLASVLTFNGNNVVKVSGNEHFTVLGSTVSGDVSQGQSNGTIRLLGTFSSVDFTGSFAGNDGISLQVGFDPALVPEPQGMALWLAGLAYVSIAVWRRQRGSLIADRS